MILADLSIKRPVLMTMVILAFVVVGLFSFMRVGIDMFPEVNFPYVSVMTIYPGAGPQEIEILINQILEEEISSVSGVKNLFAISQEGFSLILVELQLGQNLDIAAIDIKDKIDAKRMELPSDIEAPIVQKFDFSMFPVMSLSVTGDKPLEELFLIADRTVKPELSKIPGIASIALVGEKSREIQVQLSMAKLRAYEISPLQIMGMLGVQNMTMPAGRIERGKREFTVRLAGEYDNVETIAGTLIQTPKGKVRLDELGKVEDTFTEQRELARFNREISIGVELNKRSDANTVQVANDVNRIIKGLSAVLPEGVTVEVAQNNSVFITDSVEDVRSNLMVGILFTAIVLFMFLHSWRGTIIAALSMPVSIIATFTLIAAAGFTLNMMSLMGLAISVGILVVNAIVVLENIERHRAQGKDMATSASVGTKEIALAVSAATLTNVVVFTPMGFMSGMIGQFFKQFGLTVAFATIFSLFISFTLTPMMASREIKKIIYVISGLVTFVATYLFIGQFAALILVAVIAFIALATWIGWVARFSKFWNKWYDELANDYRNLLRWTLNHKTITLSAVTVLFFFGIFLFKFIGSEFMPSADERSINISIEMPAGARLEETDAVLMQMEEDIYTFPEVDVVYTALGKSQAFGFGGGQGVQYGNIVIKLKPRLEGMPSTLNVVRALREKFSNIPAAKMIVAEMQQMGGGGGEAAIQIQLQGADMAHLADASERVVEMLNSTGKVANVRSDWTLGKPEIVVRPDRAKLADLGISIQDVALNLRTMFEGMVGTRFREGGYEYDVRIFLDEVDRNRIDRIGDLLLPTFNGYVPLRSVAIIELAEGPTQISRKNKQRMITVSGDPEGISAGEIQGIIVSELQLPPMPPSQMMNDILTGKSSVRPLPSPVLPEGVTVYFGGSSEMMAESFSSLLQALLLAIILTYMLLAAILESYRYPFIIMMTLPLSFIGLAMGLVITGKALSMIAMMAIVMLVGIVVNNGILLIDYTVHLWKEGRSLDEAILEACPIRLRPIIMSTMATVLGMFPLALGLGSGGEFRSPMAVVAIGGLISSTVLSLFVIPILFRILERKKA